MSDYELVKEEYIRKPKSKVILQTTEKVSATSINREIESYNIKGHVFSGVKFVTGFAVKALIERVHLFLGYAFAPLSVFLSIVKSAVIANLKLKEVENRINELIKILSEFSQLSYELCSITEKLLIQATIDIDLTDMEMDDSEKQAFGESFKNLIQVSKELISLRNLGEQMLNELNSLPTLEQKFRQQGSIHSRYIADRLSYLIGLGEFAMFKKSLNNVRSTIFKLES